MKYKFLITGFLGLLLGHFFVTQAQNETAFSNFVGTISAINSESGEITILTAENSSFTVNARNVADLRQVSAGETTLQNSTAITFDQIAIGDKALIRGKLSEKTTIVAKQIVVIKKVDIEKKASQKREDWKRRGIVGTVIKTDSTNRKISVQIKNQSQSIDIFLPDNVVVQRYRANATSLNDFNPSTIEEIEKGAQIRALGEKSADGLQFNAEEVFVGAFSTYIGKVISVDPQNNELRIGDSANKAITVKINSESNVRRLTQEIAGNATSRPNEVDGKINLTNLLEMLPKTSISEIKVGDTIAVAGSSAAEAEKITVLILVIGLELLNNQSSKKSAATPKRNINLDVF